MKLAFIHQGSQTAKMIIEETGILRYRRGVNPEVIINYGVAGEKFKRWKEMNPWGSRLPMINKPIVQNKYGVINLVDHEGIKVPETRGILDLRHNLEGWLEKPFYSQGGQGIQLAQRREGRSDKYYQQFIHNREYELRVHTFKWIPSEEWVVQKRVGEPGEITWNHCTGGRFITVNNTCKRVFEESVNISKNILELLEMQFGGVDFIVDRERKVYFIEINSAVGCSGLSDRIYIDAFERLKDIDREEVEGYAI